MVCILGIDNGLTVTKAVIFDEAGQTLAVARRRIAQSIPRPRTVERDMAALWTATADAIREAIAASGRPAGDIAAVAATAHGDGLYLLDASAQPLGPGILSLDSRAGAILADWARTDTCARALALTGQEPHLSAPSTLLAWIKVNEPERYARIGHVVGCKDWLRYCLTGTVGTDRTEASTSFTDVNSQAYAPEALSIFGLEAVAHALAPVSGPAEIVGHITAAAASQTGLVAGTPVAAGLHDVTASALGIGGQRPGSVDIVAGTYSINEAVSDAPKVDPRWFCRNAIEPGRWNAMSISPASATNYDWFLDTLCAAERQSASAQGADIHAMMAHGLDAALERPSTLLFHPFLFGSPHGSSASAGFVGLHGWHDRDDMLRAVIEGIAFNHRHHVDALHDAFAFTGARLTGGIARNAAIAQLFADILDMPVTVSLTEEAAAWGAALCAGAGIGLFETPMADPRGTAADGPTYRPRPERAAAYAGRYAVYRQLTQALAPVWPKLEALGDSGRSG